MTSMGLMLSQRILQFQFTVINPVSGDFEGPVMSEFSLSPSPIDLSNGSVTVTASVRITDQTGVANP